MSKRYTLKKRGGASPQSLKLITIPNIHKNFIKIIEDYKDNKTPLLFSNQYNIFLIQNKIQDATKSTLNYCLNNIYTIGNKITQGVNSSGALRSQPSKDTSASSSSSSQYAQSNVLSYLTFTQIPPIDINNIIKIKNGMNEMTFIKVDKYKAFTLKLVDPDNESEYKTLTNYISAIYKYGIITDTNYDDLIILYCSFTIIYSLSNTNTVSRPYSSFHTMKSSSPSSYDSETINPFIKSILNPTLLNSKNPDTLKIIDLTKSKDEYKALDPPNLLIINMVNAFNKIIEPIHNKLIYIFSPYNIFNKYIQTLPELNNNIGIMQICILLYSTVYTFLQKSILSIVLTKSNTFDETYTATLFNEIIKNKQPINIKTNLIPEIIEYMRPIYSYLLFLYGPLLNPPLPVPGRRPPMVQKPPEQPPPPEQPFITKYNDFIKMIEYKDYYKQLAQTINEKYGLGIDDSIFN